MLLSAGPKENITTTKFQKRPWVSFVFNDILASYGLHPPGAPELAENLSHPLKTFPGTSAIIFSAYRFSTGTFAIIESAYRFSTGTFHDLLISIPLLDWNLHENLVSVPLLDTHAHTHTYILPTHADASWSLKVSILPPCVV